MNKLIGHIEVLLRWHRLIVVNTVVITLAAVVVSFVLPARYTAVARLLPPPEDDAYGLAGLLGGGLSNRLGRLGGGLLGATTPSDVVVGVLESQTVLSKVVERCSILDIYRVKRRSTEQAERLLKKMTDIAVSDEGIVSIAVEGKTPELAARIANCYVDELDEFLRTSNVNRGRSVRLFVESRLAQLASEAQEAQDSLAVFQTRNHIGAVEEELKAAVGVYADLKSRLMLREAQLALIEQTSGEQNPNARMRRSEVEAYRGLLRGMESQSAPGGYGIGFAVSLDSMPTVAGEFFRRYRNVRAYEEAYALLFQQLEYAKILEARDTPVMTILDRAVPPERRSFPRRAVIVLIAFVFSLAVALSFAYIREYFGRMRCSRPDEYGRWEGAVTDLSGVLKGLFRRRQSKPS